jgi:hypothetical protein
MERDSAKLRQITKQKVLLMSDDNKSHSAEEQAIWKKIDERAKQLSGLAAKIKTNAALLASEAAKADTEK